MELIKLIMIINGNSTGEPKKLLLISVFDPSTLKHILSLARFAVMEVFTSSFEVFCTLNTGVVLLIQDIQTLFILVVNSMVFFEENLGIVIEDAFFAELKERSVALVDVF